jgi:CMP-N,N'-diacetyllegionaminic acid synthase
MLVHTIEAARASGVFDRVIVSTEDDGIARIAEIAGAVSHKRPRELAGDLVSATDVCIEVAEALEGKGTHFDAIVCLQPSSPLRNAHDIAASWQHMAASGADYLVSVTPIDPHYFHWAVHKDDANGWEMFFRDRFLMERPLLPPAFRPNGAIKIGKMAQLKASRNFFGPKLEVYEMPENRSIHVADRFDFDLADFLLCRQRAK